METVKMTILDLENKGDKNKSTSMIQKRTNKRKCSYYRRQINLTEKEKKRNGGNRGIKEAGRIRQKKMTHKNAKKRRQMKAEENEEKMNAGSEKGKE